MVSSKNSGDGRVVIPSNVDRDVYIRKCYDTARVDVMSNGAGLLRQVSVCSHCIQDIEFPADHEGFGSAVVYNKMPNREAYVVYGVVKELSGITSIDEHQFSIGKVTAKGISTLSGDGSGSMVVTVNNNDTGGSFVVNVGNEKVGGKVHLNVSGEILAEGDTINLLAYDGFKIIIPKTSDNDMTEISYVRGSGFLIKDEFSNEIEISKDGITIYSDKSIDIVSDTNTISMDDSGINIDSGDNPVTIGGNHEVLYSKIPFATEIVDVAQIGVSTKIKVG